MWLSSLCVLFLLSLIIFIYSFLAVLGLCHRVRFALVGSELQLLFVAVVDFSLRRLLLLGVWALECMGFHVVAARGLSHCNSWAPRAQAQQLWHKGSDATEPPEALSCVFEIPVFSSSHSTGALPINLIRRLNTTGSYNRLVFLITRKSFLESNLGVSCCLLLWGSQESAAKMIPVPCLFHETGGFPLEMLRRVGCSWS